MEPITRLPERERRTLRSLLDYLADGEHKEGDRWQGRPVTRINGGWCNLLYRVATPSGDWAVKFVIRDRRDRAGREYNALLALRQAGLSIAPEPLLLDRSSYPQPVVVQTWLEGQVSVELPSTDGEWQKLLQHLATVHSVTAEKTSATVQPAVVNANDIGQGRKIIWQQVALLPPSARPASLLKLLEQLETADFPHWPKVTAALCRADNNILNFVRRPGAWASVDWENGGWGDPAFEIAQLMTHPVYINVPSSRWKWVVEGYCEIVGDKEIAVRIWAYYKILALWWMARVARYLYELPRGLDERLVSPPEGWNRDRKTKYEHYLRLADSLYA